MENSSNKRKFSPTVWHPAARWAFVLGLCAVAGVIVSYYWRVFYGLDARGVPPLQITGLCVVLAMAAGAAALLLRHCKDFAKRGACCILLCGALFAFANPPLQTPDETDHYLRTYAISMGRFDFDAKRSYPEDVNELMDAFPGAWVNAHTSAGLGTDPDTNAEQPYNTAGYALKQYGKDGRVESIWDSFTQYINWEKRDSAADSVTEPISFLILPFLPGALGMALARLFGFGALGCLYGGRLMNLLVYTLLCYAALRSAKKCRPAFLAVLTAPAASSVTKNCSESILCFERSSTSTVRKFPSPTCSVTNVLSMPLISMRFIRCFEKCMPAVGAATAPSFSAKMVW